MFIIISWFYRPSLYCIKPLCNLNLFCSIWSIIVNVKFYLNLVICNKWLTTSKCFMLKIWICFIMSLVIKIFLKRKIWSFHVLEIRSFSTANVGCVNLTIFCSYGVHSQCYQIGFLNVFRYNFQKTPKSGPKLKS